MAKAKKITGEVRKHWKFIISDRYKEGMEPSEIAEDLGLTRNQVKGMLAELHEDGLELHHPALSRAGRTRERACPQEVEQMNILDFKHETEITTRDDIEKEDMWTDIDVWTDPGEESLHIVLASINEQLGVIAAVHEQNNKLLMENNQKLTKMLKFLAGSYRNTKDLKGDSNDGKGTADYCAG